MDAPKSISKPPVTASLINNNSTLQNSSQSTAVVTHCGISISFGRRMKKLVFKPKDESELVRNCLSSARKLLEQEKIEITDRNQAFKYYKRVLQLTNNLELADYWQYICCLDKLQQETEILIRKGALPDYKLRNYKNELQIALGCLDTFYQTYKITKVISMNNESGVERSFNLKAVATLGKYELSKRFGFLQLRDGNLLTGPAFGEVFKSFEVWELNTHKMIRKYTGHGGRVRPWTQLKNGWIVYGESQSTCLHGWPDNDLQRCDDPSRLCPVPTRKYHTKHLPVSQTIKPIADDLLAMKTLGVDSIAIEKIPWGHDTIATLQPKGTLSDFCNLEVVDDHLLAIDAGYQYIHLWETKNYSEVGILTNEGSETASVHNRTTYVLSALNNGLLASGGCIFEGEGSSRTVKTGVIQLWEPRMMKCLVTTEGHTGRIRGLTHLSNGLLASTSEDNTLKLWDVKSPTLECVATFDVPEQGNLIQLSNGLIPILEDCCVRLYDLTETSALF